MHLESHTDYRTTFDPSKHITDGGSNGIGRMNSSITSRWHSLDSVSRPVLAKNVNNIIRKSQKPITNNNNSAVGPDKKINARAVNAKPPSGSRQVNPSQTGIASSYRRERTDLPKSFASMPQIGVQSPPQKYQQQQQRYRFRNQKRFVSQ